MKFQVVKAKSKKGIDERGIILIPKAYWRQKGWVQGQELSWVEGIDGSLIIRKR